MEKIHGNTHFFCAYTLKIYMKAQKHACFHVFSPFRAHLYDNYTMGRGDGQDHAQLLFCRVGSSSFTEINSHGEPTTLISWEDKHYHN